MVCWVMGVVGAEELIFNVSKMGVYRGLEVLYSLEDLGIKEGV